jgi:hypothetical protein
MLLTLSLIFPAAAEPDLPRAFADAADEFSVPESVLLALAFEASGWSPDVASQWGGYGLFDLREPGEGGMDVERAAMLLDRSPDELIDDPIHNIRGAAALLAESAELDGVSPPVSDLLAWWGPVMSFSANHAENMQDMYASFIFDLINEGIAQDAHGLVLDPVSVDYRAEHPVPAPPPASPCDYAGCHQYVQASSSNYTNDSRTTSDISYIVIHTVQGSYDGCISWFQNASASVSAHYVVRSSDGQVTQMLKEEDVGWHAGNWSYNEASIGIEHEGYIDAPETWYTDAMYASSAALAADIIDRNNITLSRSAIIAHTEVPGATHTDPGDGWDWDHYMDLIGGEGGVSTGDLLGVVAAEDIYHGERLIDATVWIAETGETVASDGEGYYYFYDLPLGSYTIHADAPGYLQGTCEASLSAGTNWCSLALLPGEDDETGSGEIDQGDPGSESGAGGVAAGDVTGPPGSAVPIAELGCTTTRSGSGAAALLVALGMLLPGRRRRG